MNEWISVKDRLPEKHEYVLVYRKSEGKRSVNLGYFHPKDEWFTTDGVGYPTHWMPLPDPPAPPKPREFWRWEDKDGRLQSIHENKAGCEYWHVESAGRAVLFREVIE